MFQFKLFNNFNTKKKSLVIVLLILALLFILGSYNREVITSYVWKQAVPIWNQASPSTRRHLIKIAQVAIPLKNLILMRNVEDKIVLLKSSGSCIFCDLTQGNFKGNDLKGVDLRYAILSRANLSNTNLSGTNLRYSNLSGVNLTGVDLSNKDLTGVNLGGVDLSNKDFTRVNLTEVDLSNKNLTGTILAYANLSGTNLSNSNLTGTILAYANLSGANLGGVDLSNKDLTGVNLTGVDLSNKDLTGTILAYANLSGTNLSNSNLTGTNLLHVNLSGTNLSGVDLSNKDLTGVNLTGVDLSNKDLTGTIIKDVKKIEISLKQPGNSNWPASNEVQNLNVTRYDLSGDVQYLATKEGFLFESKNNESRLVLDLNNDSLFPFSSNGGEKGLLGIVSQNNLVYVSYTSKEINGFTSLVVDEYSMNFTKVRNIIKIVGLGVGYYGGNLLFDSLGKLYLSVGDGDYPNQAQDLNSLKGKILRLDVSKLKLEPEIVAYGLRAPWGGTIDSKDRMFILQCGNKSTESVFLLNDLYSGIPANLGWPVFEGSLRVKEDSLMFNDVLTPIYETNKRPGCLTAGVYLNDIELFLLGDFYGTIRFLKQKENGEWYLFHKYKQEKNNIWGFGLDTKTKKIFIAPNNLELEILVDQVKLNE